MLRRHRLNVTLATLVGLAVATMWASRVIPDALTANAALLAIAAVKGRRLALDYLDLRTAPAMWRGLVSAWVFFIAAFTFASSALTHLI